MILFPAIDLKGGRCVRLKLGNMDEATVFNEDPAAQAESFEDQGFDWIHLVDLDGAVSGKPVNDASIGSILRRVSIPVQLGGGIRDMAGVERWIVAGIRRVILGTAAQREPELVKTACREFPGRIAVGIDARGGRVSVAGWAETVDMSALELAMRFTDSGVSAIIYTDIDRDGILAGLNFPSTIALARSVPIPVIASGGLASMEDIRRLASPECRGLEGAITGRALYDGRIDAGVALRLLRNGT